MITPTTLGITAFMPFGPRQEIDLSNQGTVLVDGENRTTKKARSVGAGKSSLLEAIVWCYTGRRLRGGSAEKVINRKLGKGCLVEHYGKHDDVPFTLTRGRAVKGKNIFDFVYGGKNLTAQGDPKETQRMVKLHLGLDYDILTNTFIFNGQDERWRFTSLTDAAQKSLLDKILGIEKISSALKHVKEHLEELNASAAKARYEVDGLQSTLTTLKRAKKTQRQETVTRLRGEVKAARRAWENAKTRAKPVPGALGLNNLVHLRAERAKEHREALDACTEIVKQVGVLKSKAIHAADTAKDLRRKASMVRQLATGSRCEECGSEIAEASREEHARKYEASAKELDRQEAGFRRRAKLKLKAMEKLSTHAGGLEDLLAKADEEIAEYRQAQTEARAKQARVDELEDAYKRAVRSLEKAKSAKASSVDDDIKRTRIKLEKAKHEALASQVGIDHYMFWVNGFGNAGVKSAYLDYVVPILNARALKYANTLADGLVVEFDSESMTKKGEARDKFQVIVNNALGADDYEGNSGGEKRKADIVVARALQSLHEDRIGTRFDIAWYDEVFERLDPASVDCVMRLLQEDSTRFGSLFVITHQEHLKDYFNRVLSVIKDKDGFSYLQWS